MSAEGAQGKNESRRSGCPPFFDGLRATFEGATGCKLPVARFDEAQSQAARILFSRIENDRLG